MFSIEIYIKINEYNHRLKFRLMFFMLQAWRGFRAQCIVGNVVLAFSCLSSMQKHVWVCEFCGSESAVRDRVRVGDRVCVSNRVCVDDIYLQNHSEDDYRTWRRLEGMQDALQGALSSLLQESPRRRVALVTFNDELLKVNYKYFHSKTPSPRRWVIYGDGTSTPLTLRDWALVDYDHIWKQGVAYSIPHCIAETYQQLMQRVKDLREHGATSLDIQGQRWFCVLTAEPTLGLGEMEKPPSLPSLSPSSLTPYFYKQLAQQAVESGVIISVMTFEGTDCRLADVGRFADATGGRVNIVSIGTVATEIQSASVDNILATGVTATLIAPDGVYFPFEDEQNHTLVRGIGNVTKGLEVTFQFAVKPEVMEEGHTSFPAPAEVLRPETRRA
ncbi:hypothetical protein KUCAC02_035533 [Chaenocephalus aceratus]|nr:hypothetical protein KUCAC02_035533 [Chaenocephalus aceratus]